MRIGWLSLFLIMSVLWAAPEEDVGSTWEVLDPAALSSDWQATVESLRGNALVRADFLEERRNRLRKRPSRFDGNLIFSETLGLSLRYESVIPSTIILDGEGVLRRSLDSERILPVPLEEGGLHAVILQVFSIDLVALNERFVIEGQREEAAWALRFLPREERENILGMREVVLQGTGPLVEKIQFDRTGGTDLRIVLHHHLLGGELTPAEREERFR